METPTPAKPNFSYESNPFALLGASWAAFKLCWLALVRAFLAMIGIGMLAGLLAAVVGGVSAGLLPNGPLKVIVIMLLVVGGLVGMFLLIAYYSWAITKLIIEATRGHRLKVRDALPSSKLVATKFLGTQLLMGFITMFGYLFFVIPGLWLSIRWVYTANICIDEGLFWFDAMERSSDLVQGHFWEVAAVVFGTSLTYIFLSIPFAGWILYLAAVLVVLALPFVRYQQLKALPADAKVMTHSFNYLVVVLGVVAFVGYNVYSFTHLPKTPSTPTRVENSV